MRFAESVGKELFIDVVLALLLTGNGVCVALAGYIGWALICCAALGFVGHDQSRIRRVNKYKREARVYKYRR